MDKTEKTADEIRLEAEQNIKNLATETTKACLLYTSLRNLMSWRYH